MKCPNCQTEMGEFTGTRFCPHCGTTVQGAASVPAPAATTQPAAEAPAATISEASHEWIKDDEPSNEERKKHFRYIGGACLILVSFIMLSGNMFAVGTGIMDLLGLDSGIRYGTYYTIAHIITILPLLAMAAGLFLNQPTVTMIGAGIEAAEALIRVIANIREYEGFFSSNIIFILWGAAFVLAALACYQFDQSKLLGMGAAGAYIVGALLGKLIWNWDIIPCLLTAAAFILIGLAFDHYTPAPAAAQVRPAQPVQTAQPAQAGDSLAQVAKLKELLDRGILTQEEFDAKKRELLKL